MEKSNTIRLDRPRFPVDFNEMVEADLVLLAAEDEMTDSAGNVIQVVEGRQIHVYQVDSDGDGNRDFLVATGFVERNRAKDWSSRVRWCCRINRDGVRHLSEMIVPPVR